MLTVRQLIAELQKIDPELPVTRWVEPWPHEVGCIAFVDQLVMSGFVKDGKFVKAIALLSKDQSNAVNVGGASFTSKENVNV